MANEQFGFVFAISFIIVFAGLVIAVPSDLQGQGQTPQIHAPVDPSLIAGFEDYTNYTGAVFTGVGTLSYAYSFGGFDWVCSNAGETFTLSAKVYWAGFLFLGWYNFVNFINPDSVNLGTILSLSQIQSDADNGTVRYNLLFVDDGNDAGSLVLYWNTTEYPDCADAWLADELYFVHGVGFSVTATNNIGALLVGLLLLQLPEIPTLLQLLIVTPLWASIVYVLWYVIKEMIPFV